MKNIFYHIDLRKDFCHPEKISETKFPTSLFYSIYNDMKYEVHESYIYNKEEYNGTTDEKIQNVISEYINYDFVVAEGYACKFWLNSNYKNHLLLINPKFDKKDNLTELFKHPDNTYTIISSEYKDKVISIDDKFSVAGENIHGIMYYGASCRDVYSFYGLSSFTRTFIMEILDDTPYWQLIDMLDDYLPTNIKYYEYGYNFERMMTSYCYKPNITENTYCLYGKGELQYVNKKENKIIVEFTVFHKKTFNSNEDIKAKTYRGTWKYDNIKFANKYTEKFIKKYDKKCWHDSEDSCGLIFMVYAECNEKDNTYNYILECPIACSKSWKDIKQIVDYKCKKYVKVFDPDIKDDE